MPRLVLALALACSALAAPAVADACVNSVTAGKYRQVQRAERALLDGNFKKATRLGRRELVELDDRDDEERMLARRLRRVLALAAVRSGGAVKIDAEVGGSTSALRSAAIAWAVEVLRAQLTAALAGPIDCALDPARCQQGSAPAATAELAEALALAPATRDQALTMLTELAVADLLPSPEAWATLARLRGERGDKAGRSAAAARCRQMAARAAQCG